MRRINRKLVKCIFNQIKLDLDFLLQKNVFHQYDITPSEI